MTSLEFIKMVSFPIGLALITVSSLCYFGWKTSADLERMDKWSKQRYIVDLYQTECLRAQLNCQAYNQLKENLIDEVMPGTLDHGPSVHR